MDAWAQHAVSELGRSGHRWGKARLAVIDVLAAERCCLTAREIADALRERSQPAGMASVYRALDLLHDIGVVTRLDVGDGTARYERALPGGDHHHHLVCDRCGEVRPFSDERLERAIHELAGRVDHGVAAHDVVLRGPCRACEEQTAASASAHAIEN